MESLRLTTISLLISASPIVIHDRRFGILQANEFEKKFKPGKIKKLCFNTPVVQMPCKRIYLISDFEWDTCNEMFGKY